MKISYFFRKKSPVYHSIENIFDTVIDNIKEYDVVKNEMPFHSKGLLNRLKIALFARKNQADINHITGDIHFIAPFLRKNRTILTVHDIGSIKQKNIIKSFLLRFFWYTIPLRCVQHITVISEFTKRELIDNFKIKPYKITVVNNCISDEYQYAKKELPNVKPVILQIGTKENKNLHRVINAIQDIECKLIIIGQLSKNQTKLLKEKQIDYENFYNLSQKEMIAKYVECDIVMFASVYEGFGMPIIEANAIGRPVITSNLAPMKSVAADAAILVNPFSKSDIKSAVVKLLENDKLANDLVKRGLENVKQFRAKTITNEYLKIYNKIFDKRFAKLKVEN